MATAEFDSWAAKWSGVKPAWSVEFTRSPAARRAWMP